MKKKVDLSNSLRGMMKQEGLSFPEKFFASKDWQDVFKKLPVGRVQKINIENFMFAMEQMKIAEDSIMDEICQIVDPDLNSLRASPG